ncbi:hypothetical protein [Diaphorobacter ruginosibacter]
MERLFSPAMPVCDGSVALERFAGRAKGDIIRASEVCKGDTT